MTVNLPIRSIGRGSFPVPPDRNLQRSDSGLTGRQMLYRLIAMRMLMTNAAILSPHSERIAGPDLEAGGQSWRDSPRDLEFAPDAGTSNRDGLA